LYVLTNSTYSDYFGILKHFIILDEVLLFGLRLNILIGFLPEIDDMKCLLFDNILFVYSEI